MGLLAPRPPLSKRTLLRCTRISAVDSWYQEGFTVDSWYQEGGTRITSGAHRCGVRLGRRLAVNAPRVFGRRTPLGMCNTGSHLMGDHVIVRNVISTEIFRRCRRYGGGSYVAREVSA